MRSKHVGFLVLTVAVAALAAPALSEARSIPFFVSARRDAEYEALRNLRNAHVV